MKVCPFCGKEISDEAILCKYCHNLLIDENGNDIEFADGEQEYAEEYTEEQYAEEQYDEPQEAEAEYEAEPEGSVEDEKTIVYSKEELQKALEQASAQSIDTDEVVEMAEENLAEQGYDEAEVGYIEDMDDEDVAYTYDDEESSEEVYAQENYDPKRTLIITAIITLGICIIIIAAVFVGYRLFGFGDGESSSAAVTTKNTAVSTDAQSDSTEEEYVPQVTDDTISEDPEEIGDSAQEDPVSAADSAATTESTADSAADSSADSTADVSTTDSIAEVIPDSTADSQAAATDSIAPPAGGYYSWAEAEALFDNYAAANGITVGSYQYGTDGVEMVFSGTDSAGVAHNYRVDLVTGAITVVQ